MARSEHHPTGLLHYNRQLAYRGYTLFASGEMIVLIDMQGRFVKTWDWPGGLGNPTLLPSGNLLAQLPSDASKEGQKGLNGLAAGIIELDWDGNEVWRYEDEWMHHDCERTSKGTTLVIRWAPMPKKVVRKVKGGFNDDSHDASSMLGDVVIEVDHAGKVLKEWKSWEHFDTAEDVICPLDHRLEWSHCNSVSETPKGDWLLSFRRINVIAEVNAKTLKFNWKKHGIANHQHDVKYTDHDTITIFDNGCHVKGGPEFSRAVEIDAKTKEEIWEYSDNPPFAFYTFFGGSADKLPNGNMLICESSKGQLFEVTRDKKVVWDYINPVFTQNPRLEGRLNACFRAHRYGPDYEGLRNRDLNPDAYQNLNRLYAST